MQRVRCTLLAAVLLVVPLLTLSLPASANLTGAVWTTTIDGQKVNANLYEQKCPPGWPPGDPSYTSPPPVVPYLNGGPQFAHPGSWLPDGLYYFQVTDPSGKVLLSSDTIGNRLFRVWTDTADGDKKKVEYPVADYIGGYTQPHHYGVDVYTGVITIALCPFDDTPNNGGVYKLWVTSYDAYWANIENPQARFGFLPRECKTDNFKVKKLATVRGRKVDTETPTPNGLVGLHIILYEWQGKGKNADWVRIDDTVTGAEGWYSFTNLGVGKYAVCEDLPGTDSPSPDVIGDVQDYSDWIPVGPTCIEFSINKGDLGSKGKNATPGATIDLPWFVNEEEGEHFAALAGLKFLDANGNGLLDPDPEEIPLGDWVITLEEKVDNGVWQQAYDADGYLVQPQVTVWGDGTYNFGNLDVDKVYRICEYKWVDLANYGVLDYTYDPVTYTFGLECVPPVTAGWLQTAPNTGPTEVQLWPDGSYVIVTPGTAPVNVFAKNGCYIVELGATADILTEVAELRFGNKLGSICVQKLQAETETELQGWKFNLYSNEACTILAEDGFGNTVPEITTGPDGTACWSNLLAGTYWIKETPASGWVPVDPASGVSMVTIEAGQEIADPPVTFYNRAICIGLTPGYWRNWDNHYDSGQFLILLAGTIAGGDIGAADAILDKWDNSPGDEVGHMAAFLLAIELTMNLTQHPELPNPSGGSLVPECVLPGVTGSLGDWLALAYAIWDANGVGYTRAEITQVATVLDWFCNAYMP